jgi:hypothetical protein
LLREFAKDAEKEREIEMKMFGDSYVQSENEVPKESTKNIFELSEE